MSNLQTDKQKIGAFIRSLRENKGWSQIELAKKIGTTQSAVARMEAGEQNFTIEILEKISQVLNHQILSLDNSIDFAIEGGNQLKGEIVTNCSKNGAMGLLCASLLNKGKTILHGIPRIEEVFRILEVLQSLDVKINWLDKNSLEIQPPSKLNLDKLNQESASKTRTILMFLGPLIHLFTEFKLPNPQGCKLGKRSISAHEYALEKLGVKIFVKELFYQVDTRKLQALKQKLKNKKTIEIIMYEASDTATENILLAAAKIPGKTVIKFASANYMVQDVCGFLQKCGVKIEGIGTTTLTVYGVEKIDQTIEYHNSEDPIESMLFLTAAILTNSQITIKACPIDFLELELLKLEKMGLRYKRSQVYLSQNGFTKLVDLQINTNLKQGSKVTLTALPDKITCGAYPDLNMDNLPFFVPICCLAQGQSLIHDWSYENRAIYFMELTRLGANMALADPHRIFIQGKYNFQFKAAQVVCPPALRPAVIILLAMLNAKGKSILRNVYSIKRGYQELAERLNQLGAKIQILKEL